VILLVLFGITFGVSLLFSPSWLQQVEWSNKLSREIIFGGLIIIAEIVLSWYFTFLFEDCELKERFKFCFGMKYEIISKKLDEITLFEISKEKQSRKYIPNVFIESTEVKEKLRYFCEPLLFYPKIVERTVRQLQGSYIVTILEQIHYPINREINPTNNGKIRSHKSLQQNIEKFKKFLDKKKSLTKILIKKNGIGIKPKYKTNIPPDFSHLYNYAYPKLQFYSFYEDEIIWAKEDLDLLTNKLIILKGLAGHGKTNFLCDFTENFLLRKKHKCIYLPAREFNYLGEQETIEQFITRIIFSESDYQFSDILRLIKFNNSIDYLFILIDGINEHKNISLFSIALEQFIQRHNEENIKFILTCRSEYFDDRFDNLLQIKNHSLIDMDAWKYEHKIPDVHQSILIYRYFSEFNIQLDSDHVDPEIIHIFNKDKLLLRIFCEAYENEQPSNYLGDLYKLEIFNRYYEKRLDIICGLDRCLSEIITWMIEHNEFTNVPIAQLSHESSGVIEATAYENVIVRKDLINIPSIAFGRSEVINFVYDEFRDFLIASKIIKNWSDDSALVKDQIQEFTKTRSTISDGIQKYLCLWGIKNDQREFLNYLSTFTWFNLVFINAVFDSPDQLHTGFIVELIKNLFICDPISALHLIFHLWHRANTGRYPVLNIELLFTFINNFSESKYQSIICDTLNEEENYKTTYISYLCYNILQVFREGIVLEEYKPKLIRLLCYLSGVRDQKFPRYHEYGFGYYPARDAILTIANNLDKHIIVDQIHQVLQEFQIQSVNNNLQNILEHLGE